MKKHVFLYILPFIIILCATFLISACGQTEKNVVKKEFNENGELIVYYDDDSSEHLGHITKDGEDEQGLEFYSLPDGTYGVKGSRNCLTVSNAIYLRFDFFFKIKSFKMRHKKNFVKVMHNIFLA